MTIVDTLVEARRLIEEPEHWTEGESARGPDGRPVFVGSPDAATFCAAGALDRAKLQAGFSELHIGDHWLFLKLAAEQILSDGRLFLTGPVRVNDGLGHEAVVLMYDGAIELAREAESVE